jgi:hypothetical protein
MKPLYIFTTAPTGLGHLRVMDAIIHGIAPGSDWTELGLENFRANKIHALGSRIPTLAFLTWFIQHNPTLESIYTKIYTSYLGSRKRELLPIFDQLAKKYPRHKEWCIICTHFALSYTAISAKKSLEKKYNKKITVNVVVTDDSPQRVWAVEGADAIFVPSEKTRQVLSTYLKDPSVIHTIGFPVSPRFSQKLGSQEFAFIENQLNPRNNEMVHIQIPISGAAVQLPFFEALVNALRAERYVFTIVAQQGIYTLAFLANISKNPHVQTSIGATARQTVDYYESMFFQLNKPSIEITKPSEQIFKALIAPTCRGGVILLLTPPVGRQEEDNLDFLARHNLMPTKQDYQTLLHHLTGKGVFPIDDLASWQYKASHWRAIPLPPNPIQAALFIKNLKASGLFYAMLSYAAENQEELRQDGVAQFWEIVTSKIQYGQSSQSPADGSNPSTPSEDVALS